MDLQASVVLVQGYTHGTEEKVQKQTHTYMVTWLMTEEYCRELGKRSKAESTGYRNGGKNVYNVK